MIFLDYCVFFIFIVLLYICVVSCPYVIYYPTIMTRYSLFVLKVPLNPKQTNKQNHVHSRPTWKKWRAVLIRTSETKLGLESTT